MRRTLRFVCILCATMIAAPSALRCADVGRSDGDMGPSNMPSFGAPTRIKNIVTIQGVRANQLVGYGLVIGLNGTGDSLRNSPFTDQSIQAMLDRMGVNIRRANPNGWILSLSQHNMHRMCHRLRSRKQSSSRSSCPLSRKRWWTMTLRST